MKKFLATILCFVYVVASSGATINFHYCMGKFIGWDIAAAPAPCTNCGMTKETKKGCCNDKQATLQLKKDQLSITEVQLPANTFHYLDNHHSALVKIFSSICINKPHGAHSPPGLKTISPSVLNCVFRI